MDCIFDKSSLQELGEICEEHDWQTCKFQANRRGLFLHGRGAGRATFGRKYGEDAPIASTCVVKVPTEDFGRNSNRTELDAWDMVEGTDAADVLAEVHGGDPDGTWLVMRGYPSEGDAGALAEVEQKLEDAGLSCKDLKKENVRRPFSYSEESVLVDYGDGCEIEDNP